MFAQRTNWELSENQLTVTLNRLRRDHGDVLDLTASNPTQCGFEYPEGILTGLSNDLNIKYGPDTQGMLCARKAVSDYYQRKGFDVDPERIFLTSSTSEGYVYLFRLLTNPEDSVLFPRPSYPLFQFLTDLNDVQMRTYPLGYVDRQWRINQEALKNIFVSGVKAVAVVNPNNPTGSFIQKHELKVLNALCRANDAAIICDEVFWDFRVDESKDQISLVNNHEVLTFVLGGLSKTLGLPQMKLSWIILNGPEDEVEQAKARLEVIADTFLSVNTPVQNALPAWLSLQSDIQKEIKLRLANNWQFIKEQEKFFSQYELLSMDGGWYAILKILNNQNEEDLALEFLNKEHVFVHPGYFFDFEEEECLVISLLPEENFFQEGVKRIFT